MQHSGTSHCILEHCVCKALTLQLYCYTAAGGAAAAAAGGAAAAAAAGAVHEYICHLLPKNIRIHKYML